MIKLVVLLFPIILRTASAWTTFQSSLWPTKKDTAKTAKTANTASSSNAMVQEWIQTYAGGADLPRSRSSQHQYLSQNCTLDDYRFFQTCQGADQVERRARLLRQQQQASGAATSTSQETADSITIHAMIKQDTKVGILFQYKNNGKRGCAWLELTPDGQKIQSILWSVENDEKNGPFKLNLLSAVSKLLGGENSDDDTTTASAATIAAADRNAVVSSSPSKTTLPERYFQAWNERDMSAAINVFAKDVVYDDTAFATPFASKQELEQHLYFCAEAFPATFSFVVDDVIRDKNQQYMVQWHVENNGKPLPGSRGLSYYTVKGNKIATGIDFVEDSPPKLGGLKLFVETVAKQLQQEPVRVIPLVLWLAYMYVVFVSDGILPGANALQLETRTWEEVRDLSLNFFLVSPLLGLPFSPTVHPCLEGVFNLLLSWAALFAGFLSDDRKDKPNLLPFVPIVVGMQFLTSAFLLPYLATRSPEERQNVQQEDLSKSTQILAESRVLGPAMSVVGLGSIAWGLIGRYDAFGGLVERWTTFGELLSIDRVGSSFLVDLAVFGLFQGWLVDEDKKRRGLDTEDLPILTLVGKFVPFFGMAAYMTLRPSFPSSEEAEI